MALNIKPLPTPTYNAGGGKVITRYDEKPLKAKPLVRYPFATQSKYGYVMPQTKPGVTYVPQTYPRMN